MLDHELLHELLVEPVQVVERIQHRVAAAHAEEQRDLAEARLQIDDQRRAASSGRAISTAQFTASVVVPAPPLAPKNTIVVACVLVDGAEARRADVRRIASSKVSAGGGHAKNSLAPARID